MMHTLVHGGAIVDLGNVIIAHWLTDINPENFHTIDYDAIPEVPGALLGLQALNQKFSGNVTVVYNATDIAEQKILSWLICHDFVNRTGLSLERVRRSVAGRDKTSYIEQSSSEHWGTSIAIDDRLEVMNFFIGKVRNLFLFRPHAEEIKEFNHSRTLDKVRIVSTWDEILSAI